jgi:hypothetical protein
VVPTFSLDALMGQPTKPKAEEKPKAGPDFDAIAREINQRVRDEAETRYKPTKPANTERLEAESADYFGGKGMLLDKAQPVKTFAEQVNEISTQGKGVLPDAMMEGYRQYLAANNEIDTPAERENYWNIQGGKLPPVKQDSPVVEKKAEEAPAPKPEPAPATATQRQDGITRSQLTMAGARSPITEEPKKKGIDWGKIGDIAAKTGMGLAEILQAAIAGRTAGLMGEKLDFSADTAIGRRMAQEQADKDAAASQAEREADRAYDRESILLKADLDAKMARAANEMERQMAKDEYAQRMKELQVQGANQIAAIKAQNAPSSGSAGGGRFGMFGQPVGGK